MSFITDIDLAKVLNIPISLPQSQLGQGETAVVMTVEVPQNRRLDVTSLALHVPRISTTARSSRLAYATQLGNTVTASDSFFVPEDVGCTLHWSGNATNIEDTIVQYLSSSQVKVSRPQTVSLQYFELFGSAARLINTGFSLIYAGVYTGQFFRISEPVGMPVYSLMLNSPGVVALPPRSKRILTGPDVVSVAVTNNTSNIELAEVVLTGCFKLS